MDRNGSRDQIWEPFIGTGRRKRWGEYNLFCRGKSMDREHGVGFAVKKLFEYGGISKHGSELIYSHLRHTPDGTFNIVSAYAPTLYSSKYV